MLDWIQSLPIVPAVAFLWFVVFCRAGGTYLVGRGAHRLAHRGRIAEMVESPRVRSALEVVGRWGAPVVALSFLTVGFQTAANFSAGLIRMPAMRYIPALLIGGFAWAVIYATVGLAAVALWFELFLRSPWAAVAVLAILAVVVIVLVRSRRRGSAVLAETAADAVRAEEAAASEAGAAPERTARSADGAIPEGTSAVSPPPQEPSAHRPPRRTGGPGAHTR